MVPPIASSDPANALASPPIFQYLPFSIPNSSRISRSPEDPDFHDLTRGLAIPLLACTFHSDPRAERQPLPPPTKWVLKMVLDHFRGCFSSIYRHIADLSWPGLRIPQLPSIASSAGWG